MEQELESPRSQLDHQQVQMSSISDHFTRLNQLVAYTAGTSDAEADALVRLNFLNDSFQSLNDRFQSLVVTTEMDQTRLRTATRGISDLTRIVTENKDATHRRIDEERSTSPRTMENQEKGLNELQGFVHQDSIHRGQARHGAKSGATGRAPPERW